MDFNTTIDIIIKDLREAREIIDDLKQYPGVPAIQVELAKSKCKSAEEVIALLKTMKKDFQVPVKGSERVNEVESVEEVEKNDQIESITQVTHIETVTDTVTSPEFEITVKKTGSETHKRIKEKQPESNIFADRFSGMSNTFNEQLGNRKNDDGISDVIKSRPVNNLTEAIGINDKFLFVREIFNGDQLSYNEAIAKLNKVDNISDAKAVIMSYTGEGDATEAVTQLLDLVKRKLPADE
jgi:hypothetical protein